LSSGKCRGGCKKIYVILQSIGRIFYIGTYQKTSLRKRNLRLWRCY